VGLLHGDLRQLALIEATILARCLAACPIASFSMASTRADLRRHHCRNLNQHPGNTTINDRKSPAAMTQTQLRHSLGVRANTSGASPIAPLQRHFGGHLQIIAS